MKKFVLLILIALFISGCQAIQDLTDNIRKPSLSVTDVRVTDFAFDEIELTYDVEIDNPNLVAVQMVSYDYDFKINNNDFLQGSQDKQLRIESSGTSTFQIPMRLNFQELYSLFNSLRGQDEADYQLLANLDFNLPVLGETTLPLEKSGSVPMIKLPKINVSSLKVNDVNFSRADLVLNLEVDNPNGFGLLVNALSYNLDVNGRNWVDGSNSKNISISENQTSRIAIPISLNITEIGSSVIQLLNNSSDLNYELNGNFDFGATHPLLDNMRADFSFDQTGEVPLIR
ncbi:MAG: LEA type 2 family protein [Balneolaceae bacterium]|nr:LEA type 2 family protein [Balneolaceae bacterium]